MVEDEVSGGNKLEWVLLRRSTWRMSMVLSKWIITPIKVGCKSRK